MGKVYFCGINMDNIICQSCGSFNSPMAKYCINCGNQIKKDYEIKIIRTCDICKSEIPLNSQFCPYCGEDFAHPKIKGISHKLVETNPKCPYCGYMFESSPKKKTKCLKCKNYAYVRTTQTLFDTPILTKDDALVSDLFKDVFESRGINRNVFLNKRKELSKSLGHTTDSIHTIFSLCDDLIQKGLQQKNYHEVKMIYYSMALFQNRRGVPTYELRKECAKYELLSYKENKFSEYVEIPITQANKCENCKKLEGKVFSIDEALISMPLPCKDCTYTLYDKEHGFCRCFYNIYLNDE